MCDAADDDFGGCCIHFADMRHAVAETFDEQPAVGIEHDFDHGRVVEGDAKMVAKRLLQFADQARMRAKFGHGLISLDRFTPLCAAGWCWR